MQEAEQKQKVLLSCFEVSFVFFSSTIIPHTGSFASSHLLLELRCEFPSQQGVRDDSDKRVSVSDELSPITILRKIEDALKKGNDKSSPSVDPGKAKYVG